MHWEQQIQYASLSDVGFRRRNNEDANIVRLSPEKETWTQSGHLFVVADGMGGHAVGELASKIAIDTISHTYFKSRLTDIPDALKAAIETANSAIHERGEQNFDFNRMGTTCATLVLSSEGAVTGHVGDSRVYRVRDHRIDQLTCDHSLQWELQASGRLKPEHTILHEARHIITRSVGPEAHVEVDIEGPFPVRPGDSFVLCSDGLTAHVEDDEIGVIARELPVAEACRLLVHLANLRGGSDNITVIAVRIGDVPTELAEELSAPTHTPSEPLSWRAMAIDWGIASLFAIGVLLALVEQFIAGTALVALAFIATFVLLIRGAAERRKRELDTTENGTVPSTPYRTARVKLTRQFLSQLGSLESELQKTALEENWSVDWAAQEAAHASARDALKQRQYTRTLQELGKSIDTLMVWVHAHRKQIVQAARWGKKKTAGQ